MAKQVITDWTHGLDVLTDVRRLPPNSDKETTAGSPLMENVEITQTGSLVSSTGYELVSEIASTGGIKGLLDYNKDLTNRYLMLTHGTKHYKITPSNTAWDDTNLGTYGAEANYVGGVVFNGAATASSGTITITSYADLLTATNFSSVKIKGHNFIAQSGASTAGTLTFRAATSNNATAQDLCKQINSYANLSPFVSATVSGAIITVTSLALGEVANYPLVYINNTGVVGLTLSGANLTGGSSGRIAVIGTDTVSKKADITNPMSGLTAMPTGNVMATFLGRLFVANGKTLYYSATGDETIQEGAQGFNDIVMGLRVEGTRMFVFTRTYHQGIQFDYNSDFNISTPLKEAYERQYGCSASKSLQSVYSNAVYLSPYGVMNLGAEENYNEQGLPRPVSLSTKINSAFQGINYDYIDKSCSIFDPYSQQYYLSVPFQGATYNNLTFVYNWNWQAWTTRTGLYPTDYAFFRKSTETKDSVYLTDYFNSRLLRFNSGYSYAGGDYLRKWVSKKFTMGTTMGLKRWNYLKVVGSMYTTSKFTVRLTVDDEWEEFTIDAGSLVTNSKGYLGDNWIGDAYLGGDPAPETKFYRFRSLLSFPISIKEGAEMQITIYNSAAEQPWKIDYLEIDYDILPERQLAAKYINNNLKP
jgi:hypothetical protein